MPRFKIGDKIHIPDGGHVCGNCKGLDVIIYDIEDDDYCYSSDGESPENSSDDNQMNCQESTYHIDEHCKLAQKTTYITHKEYLKLKR